MILLHDTPTRQKKPLEPLEAGKVRIYSCGPTVWDYAHIGNFRAFLFADTLKRYLQYRGYQVYHVMNLTDVDDRIAQRVRQEGVSIADYTQRYVDGFFADLEALNIRRADLYPRATEHVSDMVALIQRLLERGLAYERDGSVYFSIAAFPTYGEFAHLDTAGLRAGARVDTDRYDKENVRDFVLWKAWAEEDGEVGWDSPFGRGRPGWHIECSAMSTRYLGESFDIHTGGIDLVFPHHQNEIAQSEGATGQPYVRLWLHNEFVNIAGEAMSKSKGNQLTLKEMAASPEDVRAFRYLVVTSHYRTILNYSDQGLEAARSALRRLTRLRDRLEAAAGAPAAAAGPAWQAAVTQAREGLVAGMDDDLNAPRAMASVWGLAGEAERALTRDELSPGDAAAVRSFMGEVDEVFGVPGPQAAADLPARQLPGELAVLIEQREAARRQRDWQRSDELRARLDAAGVLIKDTPAGPEWTWK
ncbi:MAG: cysteine--tRNA ligase [Gemmatimonadota bacterium]